MNIFYKISTENFEAISHENRYLYNQYDSIDSFIKGNFDPSYANLLAKPIFKKKEVTWFTNYDATFKRISEFNELEKERLLQNYWFKIATIKSKIEAFKLSQNIDKRNWAFILNEVFNDENNIIFSDGENIVLLWGWRFRNNQENFIPIENRIPLVPLPIVEPKVVEVEIIPEPIKIPSKPPKEPSILLNTPKTPWWMLIFNGLWLFIKRFWWIFLLMLLLLLLAYLIRYCSPVDVKYSHSLNLYNPTEETIIDLNQNNPTNKVNTWDIDGNNTGLENEEYQQIVENNNSHKIYENLLIDENGNQRLIPNKPRVNIPIDEDNIVLDDESHQYIVPDRINVVLKNKTDDIVSFAEDFKTEFPEEDYQIIYRDEQTRRLQIRVPENEREELKSSIKQKLFKYELLMWDETIFQTQSFNDPALTDDDVNWFLKNIKVEEAWNTTTGNRDIRIAVIDDGFDLNHAELNKNIVSPWNIINQDTIVFASKTLTHGSHVAGIALSKKNNNKGLVGIAPDCSFMPIQICSNNGLMSSSTIIDGVLYAINHDADVINLSIQTIYSEEVLSLEENIHTQMMRNTCKDLEYFWAELFEMANKKNITIVYCAGNQNLLIGVDPMLRDDNIIIVSAVDKNNKKADFSNYGNLSTISAPGVDIFSCAPGNRFVFEDGTSMAAPIITGVVALMKSLNPELTNKQIKNILQTTGKRLDSSIGPLVQVDKAIKMANGNESNDDSLNEHNENSSNSIIQQKIDKLREEIENLKNDCPECN